MFFETGDYHHPVKSALAHHADYLLCHRHATDTMKHFRIIRFHARPLSGRQNERC